MALCMSCTVKYKSITGLLVVVIFFLYLLLCLQFCRFVTNFMSLLPLTRGKLREDELSNLNQLIDSNCRSSNNDNSKNDCNSPTFVLVFPEGTRSPDGRMKSFKTGVSYLSMRLNLPVVPVYIHGTSKALPKGKPFSLNECFEGPGTDSSIYYND